MKTSELLRKLKKNGITFIGHGKKHDEYYIRLRAKNFKCRDTKAKYQQELYKAY